MRSGVEVETATGPVSADSLGFVLPHEHLVWADAGWQYDTVPKPDDAVVLDAVVGLLEEAADTGVRTVVDPTPAEMGRDVAVMAAASHCAGVNVVFGTGIYCRWPTPYFVNRTAEELADYFGTELTDGVGVAGAKPAFVKLAIESADFTPHESAAMVAAASVHRQLDTPILVHCQPGVGLPVLRRLVGELDVGGNAIVIGHAEGVSDLTEHLEIVRTYGASVGFDRFGLETFGVRDDVRIGLVTALCGLGYADRIHLSHDYAGIALGRNAAMLADRRASMPRWQVSHVGSSILPSLRDAGVTDEHVRLMTEVGPARWLSRSW